MDELHYTQIARHLTARMTVSASVTGTQASRPEIAATRPFMTSVSRASDLRLGTRLTGWRAWPGAPPTGRKAV